jgi:preprotein translocase subunit YajC
MLDFANMFIGTAMAQTAVPSPSVGQSVLSGMDPKFFVWLLVCAVIYFIYLRPQQKRINNISMMPKNIKKGDKVVTSGGIIGTITKLEGEEHVMVEIASGVQVKIVRSTINSIFDDTKLAK